MSFVLIEKKRKIFRKKSEKSEKSMNEVKDTQNKGNLGKEFASIRQSISFCRIISIEILNEKWIFIFGTNRKNEIIRNIYSKLPLNETLWSPLVSASRIISFTSS